MHDGRAAVAAGTFGPHWLRHENNVGDGPQAPGARKEEFREPAFCIKSGFPAFVATAVFVDKFMALPESGPGPRRPALNSSEIPRG